VRATDGTITSFNPPVSICFVRTIPTSINDDGVITGVCTTVGPGASVGWVRFP
jgi:hypothetical protein